MLAFPGFASRGGAPQAIRDVDIISGQLTPTDVIQASSFLAGSALLGWVLYRILLRRLRRRATITTWGGDDIVLGALHDVILVWFATAGAYFATQSLPLSATFQSWLDRALLAIVILSATLVASRMATDSAKLWALRTGGAARTSSIFVALVRLALWIVGLLVLLSTLGISIAPILTALGVGGLAVALALQDTLANLFAGIQILASRKVRPGDYIRLDSGHEGYVTDISWRNTTMRQLPDNVVIVPNAKLSQAIVVNFNEPVREMTIMIEVGVAYESDLDHVERVTKQVATEVLAEVQGGVPGFEPVVRFNTFGDWAIVSNVILRVQEFADQYLIRHEFVKRLHERYRSERIEIPFPVQRVLGDRTRL